MFNKRKIFSFSTTILFSLFSILNEHQVKGTFVTAGLPICRNAANSGSPETVTTGAKCLKNDGSQFAQNNICLNEQKTNFFIAGSNDCTKYKAELADGYYLFSCTTADSCTELANTGAGLGAVSDADANILLYQVTNGVITQIKNDEFFFSNTAHRLVKCGKHVNGQDYVTENGECNIMTTGYFINPDTDEETPKSAKPLIKVVDNAATAEVATLLTGLTKSYYLNEDSNDGSDHYSQLIICTKASGENACSLSDPIPGTYLDEGSLSSGKYVKVITCDENHCTTVAFSTENEYYINGAVSGSLTKALIYYDGTDYLLTKDGVADKYYLHDNGSLIHCDTKCEIVSASTIGVYLDQGTYNSVKSGFTKVIKCSGPTTCAYTVANPANGNIYINAAIPSGGKPTIIKCTENGGDVICNSVSSPTAGYYADSDVTNNVKNIIQCSSGSGCVSREGSKENGVGYPDASNQKKIIYFNGSAFVTIGYTASKIYFIDARDDSRKTIIGCEEQGSNCDEVTVTIGEGNTYKFFDGAVAGVIISCKTEKCVASKGLQYCENRTGGCKKLDGSDPYEENQHCISIDGNIYQSTKSGVDRKRGAGDTCTTTVSADVVVTDGTTTKNYGEDDGYIYLKSGSVYTQLTDLGYFDDSGHNLYMNKNDGTNEYKKIATATANTFYLTKPTELVKCTGAALTTCSVVAEISAGYYVNGNSGTDRNVIKCNNTSCEVVAANQYEFYLNSGDDKGSKPLIDCTSTTCVAAVGVAGSAAEAKVLINAADTSKLIICSTATSCTGNTSAVEGYYIDAKRPTTHLIHCVSNISIECTAVEHGNASANPIYYIEAKSSGRKIIKCLTGGCTLISSPMKGYYINSGPNTKAISCDGTTCKEVADVDTCSTAGKIIKNNEDVEFCITNTEAIRLVSDSSAASYPYYKAVTLVAATDFPGNTAEKSITVKIDKEGRAFLLEKHQLPECSNNTPNTQYCTEVTGRKMIIKKGANNGSPTPAVGITNNDVFGTDDEGNSIVEDGGGTYPAFFDDNNGVVLSTAITASTGAATMSYLCTFTSGPTLDNCVLVSGYSKIATGGIYCSGWKGDECRLVNAAASCVGNHEIGIIGTSNANICLKTNNVVLATTSNIVFYVSEPNKYFGVPANSYVNLALTSASAIVTTDKTFIGNLEGYQINRAVDGSLENALLKCSGTSCTVETAQKGFYISGDADSDTNGLIECTTECKPFAHAASSYYISALESTSKIIYCDEDKECSKINHNGTQYAPTHYLNGSGAGYGKVITCNHKGCFIESDSLKGYFLNSAGDDRKSLIKCDGSNPCALISQDPTEYTAVGTVKVVEGKVKMCIAVGCSGSGEVTIENSNSEPLYRTITVGDNIFPGVSPGDDITVKIGNDGSIILLERIDDAASYATTIESITNVQRGTKLYFFTEGGERVEDPTSTTLPTDDLIAYQCHYDVSDNKDATDTAVITLQKDCTRVIGYATLDNGQVVHCSGWRRDGCTLMSLKSCSAEDEGKLGSGKKLCFGTEGMALPSGSAKNYLSFKPFGINVNFGKEKSNGPIFLEMTSSSVIAIDPPDSLNGLVATSSETILLKDNDKYRIYTYTAGSPPALGTYASDVSTEAMAFETMGKDTETYIHYGKYNDETTVLFYCAKGVCKKSKGYMIIGDAIYGNVDQTSWVALAAGSKSETCTTAEHVNKFKIDGGALKVCVKKGDGTFGFVNSGTYFFGANTDLKMYKFGGDVIVIAEPDDGYYMIKNNEVISSTTEGSSLVECKNGKCSVVETPEVGFYSNAGGVKIIKCSGSGSVTCDFDTTAENYYIDSKNQLVSCNGSHECSYETNPLGYYKNAGDTTEKKYIQCTKTECKAIAEPTEDCNEANIGKLAKHDDTVGLCLKNGVALLQFGATGKYMVSYQTGSVFKTYVSKSVYSGLLDITANKIGLFFGNQVSNLCVTQSTLSAATGSDCGEGKDDFICNAEGVCMKANENDTLPDLISDKKIVEVTDEVVENTSAADLKIECNVILGTNCNEKTYYLIDKTNYSVLDAGVGTLYYCLEENKPCKEITETGYYIIDADIGYTCQNSGSQLNCAKITITDDCTGSGDIIYTSSKHYLCLSDDTSKALELSSNTSGNYALYYGSTNIFGLESGEYALITVKDKNITLNTQYEKSNKLRYVYFRTDSSNKLIEGSTNCPWTTANPPALEDEKIEELKCSNGICHVYNPSNENP